MKKILDLIPVPYTKNLEKTLEERKKLKKEILEKTNGSFDLDISFLEKGSTSIEDAYDEAINTPFILEKIRDLENNYDAIVIDCFGDPGLDAAREITKVPVIGVNEASTHLASQISSKFSIINILPETENLIYKILKKNGLSENLASIITINIPVLSLEENLNVTAESIKKGIEKAIREDGAESIVFGCTGMTSVLNNVVEKLKFQKMEIPIIEPLSTGIFTAVSWILLSIAQSKFTYMYPRKKERII
ncbi:MAG: aspartate/glutamate racemase family protein [Thermoplasmata archaeon]